MKVIGVSSGKGGVGKTTVAVNLATELANRGLGVMLLDGDLGLSNAQILLGTRVTHTYAHVLAGEKSIEEIIVSTASGVKLAPGSSGSKTLSSLSRLQLLGLIHGISNIPDCDVLIVDTAAGITDNVTILFSACDIRLVVVQNEPSSIADAYAMIKVLKHEYDITQLHLLPCQIRSKEEAKTIYERVNKVTMQYLDLHLQYAGSLRKQDELILESARKGIPFVNLEPKSPIASDISAIADNLMSDDNGHDSGSIKFFVERLSKTI
jgi:flagellar biosynthesis protein FlhG